MRSHTSPTQLENVLQVLENIVHELGDENQLLTFSDLVRALEGDDGHDASKSDKVGSATINFASTSAHVGAVDSDDEQDNSSSYALASFVAPSAAAALPKGFAHIDSESYPLKPFDRLGKPTESDIGDGSQAAGHSSGSRGLHSGAVDHTSLTMTTKGSNLFVSQEAGPAAPRGFMPAANPMFTPDSGDLDGQGSLRPGTLRHMDSDPRAGATMAPNAASRGVLAHKTSLCSRRQCRSMLAPSGRTAYAMNVQVPVVQDSQRTLVKVSVSKMMSLTCL